MRKEIKKMFPLNLQFFAEADDADDDPKVDDVQTDVDNDDADDDSKKTFTQEEVNSLLSASKKEAKKSVLKSLGFKSEAEAKNSISVLNKLFDNDNGESDNNSGDDEAKKRAEIAEAKVTCLMAGVEKSCIEDVIAIANKKVTSEKDLSKVLDEMKEQERYSSFFSSENSGTGSDPGHSGSSDSKSKNYGKKIAESNKSNNLKGKSNFFD